MHVYFFDTFFYSYFVFLVFALTLEALITVTKSKYALLRKVEHT